MTGPPLSICWSLPDRGGGSQHSVPTSPLALSLSRGDQCLTNNSTYFEIAADNTTLVKHGEQHRRGQAETHNGPVHVSHHLIYFTPESRQLYEASVTSKQIPRSAGTSGQPPSWGGHPMKPH